MIMNWNTLNNSDQKAYLDWIYAVKPVDKQAQRIASMLDRLTKGLKLYDKDLL